MRLHIQNWYETSTIPTKNAFHVGGILDTLNDVVLLVPTSALGLSLSLFWTQQFHLNEFLTITLAHLSFTFPLMVKPITAALSGVDENLLDASRTLGANPLKTFKNITLPLITPGIIAGVIMTFMRSLSETGATMSVSEDIKTIPVLLVELFKKDILSEEAILACILLFALSFIFLLILKKTGRRHHAGDRT